MKKKLLIVILAINLFSLLANANIKTQAKNSNYIKNIKWERYGNARFNFWGNIPKHFTKMPEPTNGDGIILTYKDIKVSYSASYYMWGGTNDDEPLEVEYRSSIEYANDRKEEITYKFKGGNYYVISGYTADNKIFYMKSIYDEHENKFVTFYAEYPTKDKEYMDKIINKMVGDIRIYIDREGKEYLIVK